MGLACVEALEKEARPRATELAGLWNVPLLENFSGKVGIKVVVSEHALGLGFIDKTRGKPYYCDFQSGNWRQLLQGGLGKSHIFRRALGIKDRPLRVLDVTAGFGQDAVMALAAGCEVTAVERSAVVAAILRDGVERAAREDEHMAAALKRFKLIQADALDYLGELNTPVDVIYLDPMFDKPKKTAKSPKEMQLLQELLDTEAPKVNEKLLQAARSHALMRVVVKCPLKSRALQPNPAHSYKGQSIRYDIYMPASS